jgi:hypothetical protein
MNRRVTVLVASLVTGAICCPSAADAQGLGTKASSVVLRTIGESPIVARTIQSLFGTASAEALRLLALPAEARGLAVIENDQLARAILGAKELSETDRLTWAGSVNTLRSQVSSRPLFAVGNPGAADLAEALATKGSEDERQ